MEKNRGKDMVQQQYTINIPKQQIMQGQYVLPHTQKNMLCELSPVQTSPVPDDCVQVSYRLNVPSGTTHINMSEANPGIYVSVSGQKPFMVGKDCLDIALRTCVHGKPYLNPNYIPNFVPTSDMANSTTYVHYGSNTYDRGQHKKVSERNMYKPNGGYWASSMASEFSWRDWASKEDFCEYQDDDCVQFKLTPNARVLKLETPEDIEWLAAQYGKQRDHIDVMGCFFGAPSSLQRIGLGDVMLDWKSIAMDFDGVDYSFSKLRNTLFSWDCDSVVIFNPAVVECVNPEQDISTPSTGEKKPLMYVCAYEECTIKDVLSDGWVAKQKDKTPRSMSLYTNHMYVPDFDGTIEDAIKSLPVTVVHDAALSTDISSRIMTRLEIGNSMCEYICTAPTSFDSDVLSRVIFPETCFTSKKTCSIEMAPLIAQRIVQTLQNLDQAIDAMSDDDWDSLVYCAKPQDFVEAMYSPGGLMTNQSGEPEYWQRLGDVMKALVQAGCSMDAQIEIARRMYDIHYKVENEELASDDIVAEMTDIAHFSSFDVQHESPEVQAIVQEWRDYAECPDRDCQ
jgi:hypothetical protein